MIKIIALDLDGTLLNSDKELSPENRQALEWAASQGIEIVPTTGRFFGAMPQVIRDLPFVHYAITINGAQAYDVAQDKVLHRAELSAEQAVAIMEYLDGYPVIYDAYMNNWGWMTKSMHARAEEYIDDPYFMDMVRTFRNTVPDLKNHLASCEETVQKVQFYTKDQRLRGEVLCGLSQGYDHLSVTYAMPFNAEINLDTANKGEALLRLADHLGVAHEDTMAMGDGSNDLSMVVASGIGVAMENAIPELKEAADYITASNDHHGVAQAIYHFCK